jgi:hypothetical protein
MNDSAGFGVNGPNDSGSQMEIANEPHPRAAGSPLPIGAGSAFPLPQAHGDAQRFNPAPPPGRALANSPSFGELPSGLQRAVSALRAALPFVQRILPLFDGNIGSAASNVMTPHSLTPRQSSPPVNLVPIEDGLADLQTQHRELCNQVAEQNSSLKRVEDQLELVREATDRNTLEQQELLEDLKGVGNKVNRFALFALGLLVVSILLNVILYLHLQRVLP